MSDTSVLKGGVIGCGFFARNHMNGWHEAEGAEIVAVCDADRTKAETFARDFGVPKIYTDAEEMLRKERLDFVDVITQPGSHRPLVELAAAHGVPVICQKPLAPTLEDGRAMVEACQAAGVPFMIHENFRWQPPMRAAKEAADRLAPLFFGRLVFRTPYDVYANQPYLATEPRFIIADLGVHLFDLARFFFGEVARITCHTQRVNPAIQGEDTATILLEMTSGAACMVEISYASPLEEDLFPQTLLHLEAANGSVVLGPHYQLTTVENGMVTRRDASTPPYPWSAPPFEMVQSSVVAIEQHWIDCLRAGRPTETSGADNLRTLELVFGAYEAAEQKRPYLVSPAGKLP